MGSRNLKRKGGQEWRKYVDDPAMTASSVGNPIHWIMQQQDGMDRESTRTEGYLCEGRDTRQYRTGSKSCEKVVLRPIRQDDIELAEDIRSTPKYKELYRRRKEKIERVFADAKEKRGMRYAQYRSSAQAGK